MLTKLGSLEEADHAWRALIEHNPENYDYYAGFITTQTRTSTLEYAKLNLAMPDRMSDEEKSNALEILCTLSEQAPRAVAPRRLALSMASGVFFGIVTCYRTHP